MEKNKVIFNDEILIDLTEDTVTPEDLRKGATAHNAAGEIITGILEVEEPTETLLIEEEGNYDVRNYGYADVDLDFYKHIEKETDPRDEWIRPSDWDDMATDYLDRECLYLVYDTDMFPDNTYEFACLYFETSSGSVLVEKGYVDGGTFTALSSSTVATKNTFYDENLNIGRRFLVYRITPATGHLTRITLDRPTSAMSSFDGVIGQNYYFTLGQPIIETYGSLPYLTSMYVNSNTRFWGPMNLVHSDIRNCTALTNCANMFYECRNLECIDGLETWDTSKVTTFSQTFYNCSVLRYVNLNNIKVTNKCTTIMAMFRNCFKLREINVSDWDTSNITAMENAFYSCYSLSELDTKNWVGGKVISIQGFVNNCMKLRKLDLSNFSTDILKANSFGGMFQNCYDLQKLDLRGFKTININNFSNCFGSCYSLREILLSEDWKTDNATTMNNMFYDCRQLLAVNTSHFKSSLVTNMQGMFTNCMRLKTLNLQSLSGEKCTTFQAMFQGCYNLEELTLPKNLVTSAATNLSNMFQNCTKIKYLDVTNFDIQNVTTLANLFYTCQNLRSFGNIDNWDYSKVTTMLSMFQACIRLKELPNFDGKSFPAVTTIANIYHSCHDVREIHLNRISAPKLTNISYLCYYCVSVKEIEFLDWNVPSLTNISYALNGLKEVQKITCLNWTTGKINTISSFLLDDQNLRILNIDLDFTATTTISGTFQNTYSLYEVINFPQIKGNATLSYSTIITPESLVKIFESLPTLTTSYKITLGTTNLNKLTAEQKAIATNKKWTLG